MPSPSVSSSAHLREGAKMGEFPAVGQSVAIAVDDRGAGERLPVQTAAPDEGHIIRRELAAPDGQFIEAAGNQYGFTPSLASQPMTVGRPASTVAQSGETDSRDDPAIEIARGQAVAVAGDRDVVPEAVADGIEAFAGADGGVFADGAVAD